MPGRFACKQQAGACVYIGTAEYTAAIAVLAGDGGGRERAYSLSLLLVKVEVEKWNGARRAGGMLGRCW